MRQRDAAAEAAFSVFVEDLLIVIGADRQAVGPVKQERLAHADGVALQVLARNRFDAQFLARAAERPAFPDVGEAGRWPEDVEIAFVEDDAPGDAGVGVEACPEHQAARLRLLHLDQDVLVFLFAVGVEDDERRADAVLRDPILKMFSLANSFSARRSSG